MDVRVRGGGRRGSGEGGERRGRVGGSAGYTRVSERKERGIMRETWVWERGGGGAALELHPNTTRRQVGRASGLYGALLGASVIAPPKNRSRRISRRLAHGGATFMQTSDVERSARWRTRARRRESFGVTLSSHGFPKTGGRRTAVWIATCRRVAVPGFSLGKEKELQKREPNILSFYTQGRNLIKQEQTYM